MTLQTAARQLHVSPPTLRLAIERGEIGADHPLADGPWILNRTALETAPAHDLSRRVERTRARGAKPAPGQGTLDFSGT